MGGACSTHGRDDNKYNEILKGRDHSEDLCVDGKTILEWMLGK
jgi:hypothetical protein